MGFFMLMSNLFDTPNCTWLSNLNFRWKDKIIMNDILNYTCLFRTSMNGQWQSIFSSTSITSYLMTQCDWALMHKWTEVKPIFFQYHANGSCFLYITGQGLHILQFFNLIAQESNGLISRKTWSPCHHPLAIASSSNVVRRRYR